jgi:mRNA interferase MazF
MSRGEIYLVTKPGRNDPRRQRAFVVVSRQALIQTKFSTMICAPVYSRHDDLETQVRVGVSEGLKSDSSIHCDELVSLPKAMLTRYIGHLSQAGISELRSALLAALDLNETSDWFVNPRSGFRE